MKWFLVVLVVVFCTVFGEDISGSEQEDLEAESTREIREYNQEGWRVVENIPIGASGWLPREQTEDAPEQQIPKRRRLRKRKRRPPMISLTDDGSEEIYHERPLRRRIRPQRLQQMREPWQEMEEEAIRRPYIRRRVTPQYIPREESVSQPKSEEEDDIIVNSGLSASISFENDDKDIKTSSEESVQQEEEEEENIVLKTVTEMGEHPVNGSEDEVKNVTVTTSAAPDLKMLLKQNPGGLSLSEILQQKNLSLTELLMGNQQAISALTEKPQPTTEEVFHFQNQDPSDIEENSTKYRRLPPSVGLRKNINRNYEQDEESVETLSTKETLEAQRKRLALLHGVKDTKIYSDVTKFDVVTEPMTEKRIFVPSHPVFYTSVNYKPELPPDNVETTKFYEETTTMVPTSTTRKIYNVQTTTPMSDVVETTTNTKISNVRLSQLFPKLKSNHNLPMTSAKLSKLNNRQINKHEQDDENSGENYPKLPVQAVKIAVNEVFGIKDRKLQPPLDENQSQNEGPVRMTIDLEDSVKDDDVQNLLKPVKITIEEYKTTTPETIKVKQVTAKEEIMEILRDPISREKLSRILETRNMTVEELVQQRERGSSQLHLADIFHNKTREPEPKGEPFVGQIFTGTNDFPMYNRKQKNIPIPIQPQSGSFPPFGSPKNTEMEERLRKTTQLQDLYTVTSFPTYKIEMDKNLKNLQQQPFLWKELYPNLFPNIFENNNNKQSESDIETTTSYLEKDVLRLDDVDNQLSSVSSDRLNIDLLHQEKSAYNNAISNEEHDLLDDDDLDEPLFNIPSGVKSAIIASFAIIGLSLIVFLTILVIFKWSQKRKTRLNYCSSFSKFKSPILENVHRRSIKTFMSETLGKKKNYYKSHVQSMSDNIWNNDNDRKQSY